MQMEWMGEKNIGISVQCLNAHFEGMLFKFSYHGGNFYHFFGITEIMRGWEDVIETACLCAPHPQVPFWFTMVIMNFLFAWKETFLNFITQVLRNCMLCVSQLICKFLYNSLRSACPFTIHCGCIGGKNTIS